MLKSNMKRIIAVALAFLMLCQIFAFASPLRALAVEASQTEHTFSNATISFDRLVDGSTGYLVGTNVSGYMGDGGDMIAVATQNEKSCWTLDDTSKNLYLNVDDLFLVEKNLALMVTVEYLDAGTGSFHIQYDKYNSNFASDIYVHSDTVNLTDSGEWKTSTLLLNGAYLMNRQAIGGKPANDAPFKRTADLLIQASGTLHIASVELHEAVEVSGVNKNFPGNIFSTADTVSIPLVIGNNTGAADTFTVAYTVRDSRGNSYETDSFTANLANGDAVKLDVTPAAENKGVYYLDVTVSGSGGNVLVQERIDFSRIANASVDTASDPYFGVQTHMVRTIFEDKLDVVDDIMEVVAKAGVQVIRDEMYWGMAEPEKDNFEFKPQWEQYIAACEESGIEPSLILSYGNNLYKEPDEQGTPTPGTAEQIAAFAEYARQMATHYKGKIKQYEVWNEWNGGMNNRPVTGSATGIKYFADTYTELLKATYTAIKSVDPDARVVGCVSSTANAFYVESVVAAGGLDYMDAVSYHPYNYPSVPDRMASEVSTFEGIRKLGAILKRYGEEKPLIISEQGWPVYKPNYSASYGVTEQGQASYLMRLYTLGLAYGAEQVIIYDLQDDGTYGAREQNFGMIEHWRGDEVPNAAKESYVALSNITTQLQGVEFVEEYSINRDLRAYHFHRPADGKDVVVMWGIYNNRNIQWTGSSASLKAYDMFGNEVVNTWIGTDPVYLVGDAGTFDIKHLVTDHWTSVEADASSNIRDNTDNGTYNAASYLSSAPWFEGMTMNTYGGLEVPEFILRGTRKGWLLQKPTATTGNADYAVLAKIDDSFVCGSKKAYQIDVEYFDEAAGKFYVYYDSVDGKKLAGTVEMTGSCEWKTTSLIVLDAYFANNLEGGDILITLKDDADEFGTDKLVFACVRTTPLTSVSVDLGTEPVSYGISIPEFVLNGDKKKEPIVGEAGGKDGWLIGVQNTADTQHFPAQQVMYFSVPDHFPSEGAQTQIEISYFDSDQLGTFAKDQTTSMGYFEVRYYDGTNMKVLGTVDLAGTNEWKTAVFEVASNAFNNSNNRDIRISAYCQSKTAGKYTTPVEVLLGGVTVRQVPPASISAVLGEDTQISGLDVMPSGNATFSTFDSYYSEAAEEKLSVLVTDMGHNSPNIFLFVDDTYLYNCQGTNVTLRLTYWDEGTGTLKIQYDGVDNKAVTKTLPYTNTGDFRTVDIVLEDVLFANRRAQKSDILVTRANGPLALHKAELFINESASPINRTPVAVTMDTTPPGEVTDLTAAELDGAVYLRWTNPADGTAAKATMDQLRVYMLDDGEYQLVNYKLDSPANNKEGLTGLMYVDGLTNGTAYTFKVTATDKWGNESEGVTIAATPRAGYFSITDLRLTDPEGTKLGELGDAVEVEVRALGKNTSDEAAIVTLIAAEYDASGTMVNMWTQERTLMSDTPEITLRMGIELGEPLADGHYLKAFVWDSLNGMVPYTPAYSAK